MDNQVLQVLLDRIDTFEDGVKTRLDRIDRHQEDANVRIRKVELWRSYLTGAMAVVVAGFSWLFGSE